MFLITIKRKFYEEKQQGENCKLEYDLAESNLVRKSQLMPVRYRT